MHGSSSLTASRARTARVSLPPLGLCRCLIGRKRLLVKQFRPGYTLSWLHTWPQNPMRRCRALRKSVFCRFMDDSVVAGLHKFDKARCTGCFAAHASRGGGGDWAGRQKMWDELPGTCHLG
jgi:hypothetical protein